MAPRRDPRPASTPEGKEQQLISAAVTLAEKQLRDGTASAQVLTHFLKQASARERLEQERLKNENLLLSAKIEQMASARRIEELYESALKAMRNYSGEIDEGFDEEYDVR